MRLEILAPLCLKNSCFLIKLPNNSGAEISKRITHPAQVAELTERLGVPVECRTKPWSQKIVRHADSSLVPTDGTSIALSHRVLIGADTLDVETCMQREHQLHAADEIILESMLDTLDIPSEYNRICIWIFEVSMFTIAFPYLPLIVCALLAIKFRTDFLRLTKV